MADEPIPIEDIREVVGAFVKRVVDLVSIYVKNPTPSRRAVIEWVRDNENLYAYWHRRYVSKPQMKILVTNLCTALVAFSDNPQCPDPGAILDLIRDDPRLVEWCGRQEITVPE